MQTPLRKLTIANQITILRISLVPVFTVLVVFGRNWVNSSRYVPLFVFLLAAALDAVDGYVARRSGQTSRLGSMLDPLADKLLMVAALVVLVASAGGSIFGRIPTWFLVIVLLRETVLMLGSVVVFMISGFISVKPRLTGKIATFLETLLIVLALIGISSKILVWHAALTAIPLLISGFLYFTDGMAQVSGNGNVMFAGKEN